jgi:putative drug exporter of the RND superfamily
MGLGMDYEIFLMTRVRDLVRRGMDDGEAATTAVVDTGRVITAAGLVMAGSLGTMALSSTLMLRQYGVGLGTAVLLDATLVRMLLVPASLLLLGRCNWWLPRWAGGGLATSP